MDLSYNRFTRRKKSGKVRIIHAPNPELKKYQRDFADWFYKINKKIFRKNTQITGFVPGKSIMDNAMPHLNKDWVVNLDIENFFPNTSKELVLKILSDLPKKISFKSIFGKEERTRFRDKTPSELAEILTLNGALPQGSPASPILANYIAINEIDIKIFNKIKEGIFKNCSNISFTRYADDITISFNSKLKHRDIQKIFITLIKEIEKGRYRIKKQKTNIKHKSQRQMVTGILVNGKNLKVSKLKFNQIKAMIHHTIKNNEEFNEELIGLLNFIETVNKEQYLKLTKHIGEKYESYRSKII